MSDMIFGATLLMIAITLILGFLSRTSDRTVGLFLIIGGVLGLIALFLILDNPTSLSLISPMVKDNYFPSPLESFSSVSLERFNKDK
ncbi:MAG: hypothetical protein ACTSPG_04580 [Candidatus Hodarchaeales archaeon]